jgi:hypothetical protein
VAREILLIGNSDGRQRITLIFDDIGEENRVFDTLHQYHYHQPENGAAGIPFQQIAYVPIPAGNHVRDILYHQRIGYDQQYENRCTERYQNAGNKYGFY